MMSGCPSEAFRQAMARLDDAIDALCRAEGCGLSEETEALMRVARRQSELALIERRERWPAIDAFIREHEGGA